MNRSLRDKRGDFIGLNVIYHILVIFYVIAVASFVFLIVHVDKDIDTFDVEIATILSRILYSDNELWFYDEEIDRLYPGILDFENFESGSMEESLNRVMHYGEENKRAAAEIILKEGEMQYDPIHYNKEKYREWIPRYKAGWSKGVGGYQAKNQVFKVLIKKGEELIPGTLEITVIIPNR